MPKGKKILLLFLFEIVLPCMLLGYLAFRGVQNDRALLEKNRLEEHRRLAGQVIQKVDENLLAAERAFQKFYWEKDQNDFSGMIRQLEGLKTSHPLIEEVFAIISDRSIRFVGAFFLYHPQVGTSLAADTRPDPSVERLIMQGERYEFQKKDHDGALGAYKKALESASDPKTRGDLLSKMARVQKKSRQFQEAIKTYEMILNKYGHILIMKGIPLGLIARMEIGALYGEMKNPAKALDTFLGLFRDLITSEWVLDKESYNFYSTRIRDSIPGILSQVSSSEKQQSQKDAFLALIDEENLKREETERLLSFLREAPSERDLLAYRSGENTLNKKNGSFGKSERTHTSFVYPRTSRQKMKLGVFSSMKTILPKTCCPGLCRPQSLMRGSTGPSTGGMAKRFWPPPALPPDRRRSIRALSKISPTGLSSFTRPTPIFWKPF